MKPSIIFAILGVLLMLGLGKLYISDSETVQQAFEVEEFIKKYCSGHNSYPAYDVIERQFPQLYPDGEWYYWPNDDLTGAMFQYPMTLPLSSAPGRSKLSEFLPIIYAYAVVNPCGTLSK